MHRNIYFYMNNPPTNGFKKDVQFTLSFVPRDTSGLGS